MFTKALAKSINELKDKKNRQVLGLFAVEGTKVVDELIGSKITVKTLFATDTWLQEHKSLNIGSAELIEVTEKQLAQISFLKSPQQVLAVCKIPKSSYTISTIADQFCIVLDTIQDPGNLGTIIRIADWYGIQHVICSPSCADVYNPKVIQATMGSFLRVIIHYTELEPFLKQQHNQIIGALMVGENLHQSVLPQKGLLLIGNEGSGISENLLPFITKPITIPKFGGAESLNAGIATAIICDAWSRANGF
jgi:TrmH family RNA methyltransferase